MGVELKKLGSLIGPKGEDGINGLTIKGEFEPTNLGNTFPFDSKINDAYIISRNAKDGIDGDGILTKAEYPRGAKRGDVYVCVKEAYQETNSSDMSILNPPIFEKKFNISWYGEYNDIHIMSTYDNYVVEGYDTDEVKVNDIIIDNGNTLNSRLGNIYKVINVIEDPSDENNEGWEIVNFEDLKTGDKVVITGYDTDISDTYPGIFGFPIFPEKSSSSINTHKAYELVITETTENSGVYSISPKDEKSEYTEKTLSVEDFIFNVEIPNEELQQIAFYIYNPNNPEDEKKYYIQVNGKTASTLRIESSLSEETKSHLFELETDNTSVAYNYIKSLSTRTDNPVYISLFSSKTGGYADWRHYAAGNGVMSNQKFNIYRMKKSIPSALPKVIVDTVASVNISQRNLYHGGDNISVKNNTISALGYNYNVSKLSFSEGNNTATGANSHSEGYKTTASGKSSHAEGNGVEAVGLASHAEGWHNIDSTTSVIYTVNQDTEDNTKYYIVYDFRGQTGPTGGSDGVFYLKHGMTFFYNNKYYCVTEVFYDETNPNNPTSFRLNQSIGRTDTNDFEIKLILGKSIGECSHIEGCNTVAYSNHAHAEGNSTRAAGTNSHTEGVETCAVGTASHAEGQSSIALGDFSHAEGNNTKAIGNYSHSEGSFTTASGWASHTEGYTSVTGGTAASNELSEGTDTTSGAYAHAEGNATIAKGISSHSEGQKTFASGNYSHAEGKGSYAEGKGSHAEGNGSHAEGYYSHAEGFNSHAEGNGSHAEGNGSHAEGNGSHAEGNKTITTNQAEHAEGEYNKSNTGTISSIGIGTDVNDRKNAFEVMQNGDIYVHGLGDYDGTNSVVEEGEVKAKTLQDCINENKLPKDANKLFYFDEENGFISSQLMYSEGLVVDNNEDFELCKAGADVSMATVASSWNKWGNGKDDDTTTDRGAWGYYSSDGSRTNEEIAEDYILTDFYLNGNPEGYIYNTKNTDSYSGYYSDTAFNNYDSHIAVGIMSQSSSAPFYSSRAGENDNASIVPVLNIDETNSIYYGISISTMNSSEVNSTQWGPSRLLTNNGGNHTISIVCWKLNDLQEINNGINLLSREEGLSIIPYQEKFNNCSSTGLASVIQTKIKKYNDVITLWFSDPYSTYDDDGEHKVYSDRPVIIDLNSYTIRYTDMNGKTITNDFSNDKNVVEIFDKLCGGARRGYEVNSNPGSIFRNLTTDEIILNITPDDNFNTTWKYSQSGGFDGSGVWINETQTLKTPMQLFSGSRLSFNRITNKLFYSDGVSVYQIAEIPGSNRNNIAGNLRPSTQPSYSAGDNIDITDDVISVTGIPQVYEEGDNITLENTTNDEGKSVLKINGLSKNALTYNPERRSIALQYNEEDSSYNEAQADYSVVMGWNNKAIREETDEGGLTLQSANSLVGGMDNRAYHSNSFVFGEGLYTQFGNTFVLGKYNGTVSNQDGWGDTVLGIVGDGYKDSNGNVTRRNVLLLQGGSDPALHYRGAFKNNASWINDFGEYFEWLDGNSDNEDRIGYMVQLNGDKIELASSFEKCIGVISATTGFIGGVCAFEWHNKFLRDEWGREIIGEDGNPIINPDFNPDLEYIPREKRKEWDVVGLIGQVLTRQDGTLEVGGFAGCKDGIATNSTYGYRVLKVINENIALLLIK